MKRINIKAENQNGDCVITLDGRIDSTNAHEAGQEIIALREKNPGGNLIIDADKFTYISSAGLRVLLDLQKMSPARIRVINVSDDLFEIFSMTGFSELMSIAKKIEEIDISGLDVVGSGANGTVYRLDDDKIVKVYAKEFRKEDIEAERVGARTAFIHNIPTAIPFKTVKAGEQYGLVFEMLKAKTLFEKIKEYPEKTEMYMRRFVEIGRSLHQVSAPATGFISMKEYYSKAILSLGKYFSEEQMEKFLKVIDIIPEADTMIHGDFHLGNVMVDENDEQFLIDMGGMGYGHPIFDVIAVALMYSSGPQYYPELSEAFLGMPIKQIHELWQCYLRETFPGVSEEEFRVYSELVDGYACLRNAITPFIGQSMPEEFLNRSTAFAAKRLDKMFDAMMNNKYWEKWNF